MNRRGARMVLQALALAILAAPVLDGAWPPWAQMVWLAGLGITVGELGVIIRFGEGNLWRKIG